MDYDILPFPPERKVIVEGGRYGIRRSIMHGLFEVDVTRARELLRSRRATDIATCHSPPMSWPVSPKPSRPPPGASLPRLARPALVFHDVNVVTMIEAEAGAVAVPHIVRVANRKTVREISDEVRAIRARPEQSEQTGGLVTLGKWMPGLAVQLSYKALRKNPYRFKQVAGTVIVTAVGMFGNCHSSSHVLNLVQSAARPP